MESTALLLITSSMSVMFGWQPMPDTDSMEGGQKIEYIVQIEPELLATLKEGQSIPITSDIPDDIGPIGRIRIVVGREDLPKQNLVTRFKPWPKTLSLGKRSLERSLEKTAREGLVETQFTVPSVQSSSSGRYAKQTASNNQILPPRGNTRGNSAAANPLGRALQQGAQQGTQQGRDLTADVKQQILPPADQLFGPSAAGSQGVQNAIDNTTNQFRRGLQRGVEQVADRAGQHLHDAVNHGGHGGHDAHDAIDPFGRSQGAGSKPSSSEHSILHGEQNRNLNTILPPSTPKGQRIDQPLQRQRPQLQPQQHLHSEPPANFADSRGDTNPTNRPGTFNVPGPSINNDSRPPATTTQNTPPLNRYDNPNDQPPARSLQRNSQWPNRPSGRDAFDLVNRPKENTSQQYPNNRQPRLSASSNGTEGPQFPDAGFSGTGSQPSSHHPDGTRWNNHPATPEIRRDMMFEEPLGRGMQTANNSQGYQEQAAARPPRSNRPLNTQPQDFGRNQNRANTAYNSMTNENTGPNSNKSLFPVVLSWILLSGSVIGNLYLFMGYRDVRNKYQGVVHGNSGRRGRYDD